jgi:Predicted phosphatase/phosphohexomutase
LKYYKALLFGSIGSIVETSEIQRKSFNKAFKQYGLDWNWTKLEYQNLLSKSGGKDRISRYAKKKKIEVNSVYLRNLKTKLFNNYLKKNHLKLRPGVKNLISLCKKRNIKNCILFHLHLQTI